MSNNPYAAPQVLEHKQPDEFPMDPTDRKKVESIIRDASQFWLAIIVCLLCGFIGAFIVPIWYAVRLIQHANMVDKYPALAEPDQKGSLPVRFQIAKIKIIIGLSVACVLAVIFAIYLVLIFFG